MKFLNILIDLLQGRAKAHNQRLSQEIENSYLNFARNSISNSASYLDDYELMDLIGSTKMGALRNVRAARCAIDTIQLFRFSNFYIFGLLFTV